MTTDHAVETDIAAGAWAIDPSHSEIGFTVRHLMSKVRGQFTDVEGTLTTGETLESARAQATIDRGLNHPRRTPAVVRTCAPR